VHGYNLANRLATISSASSVNYAINALGQRVAKTVDGVTTRYVYDEQGRLIGEYDQAGNLIQETVWLDDLPVATLRPTGGGSPTPVAVYYVHADHLGSPRAITRPSDDAILWRWDNDEPFGNSQANDDPSALGTFSYNLRFPGQQYDAETGTHYNHFRDYDPLTGRYEQSDPIGLRGGSNTFWYAVARALDRADPRGMDNPGMGPYDPPVYRPLPYDSNFTSCAQYSGNTCETRALWQLCDLFGTDPNSNCARKCLQVRLPPDRAADPPPSWYYWDHPDCWIKCGFPFGWR
jgi:RHS repeat-associated protein